MIFLQVLITYSSNFLEEFDMGTCFRKCCAPCLGCCCLIPMAFIATAYFDLTAAITGGLINGLGSGLTTLLSSFTQLGGAGPVLAVFLNGLMGIVVLSIFPIHWLLVYRPDEPMFALAMMIPWILTGFLTAILFAKSTKEGFWMIFTIGIIMSVIGILLIFGLGALGNQIPGGGAISGVIDGLFIGLTDLNPIMAILFACLEGAGIGGVFGAFAGAIKYKPGEEEYVAKKASKKEKQKEVKSYDGFGGPSLETTKTTSSSPNNCPYCGTRLSGSVSFCTNCGNKLK